MVIALILKVLHSTDTVGSLYLSVYLTFFTLVPTCVDFAVLISCTSLCLRIDMAKLLIRTFTFLGLLVTSTALVINSSANKHTILAGLRNWAANGAKEFQAFPTGPADDKPLELRLFSRAQAEDFGARTLDGSPSGYYYRAGAENDSFVIFLDGGGLCISEKDCKHRANTNKGTSTKWLPNSTDHAGLLSSNTTFNPFANWNHVRVPYGSGDVYIGSQHSVNTMGVYFAGHNTLEAIVSDLKNRSGLGSARRVLFAGVSAGGHVKVHLHSDSHMHIHTHLHM